MLISVTVIFVFSSPRFQSHHIPSLKVNIDSCLSPLSSTSSRPSRICGNCPCQQQSTAIQGIYLLEHLYPLSALPRHQEPDVKDIKTDAAYPKQTNSTGMDPIAENSSNTLVGGAKVAEDDIPRDGTGLMPRSPQCLVS